MSQHIRELIDHLQTCNRIDVQIIGLDNILALSADKASLALLIKVPDVTTYLISQLDHTTNQAIGQTASLSLVNISADEMGAEQLLARPQLPEILLKSIENRECIYADRCCMIFSNLTRPPHLLHKLLDGFDDVADLIGKLISICVQTNYNTRAKLDYIGPILSNLTQDSRARKCILDVRGDLLRKLLPFTEYRESLVRRGGIIGVIRNCCFETGAHSWLLSEEIDVLPRLLLPLADNTEFDDEDNERLPLDLQYLPAEKRRDADPDIRCMLLEALTQLCATKEHREYLRSKNTYVILRELHKWETDRKALAICEDLVNILVRTEEEIGEENLKELEVPLRLQEHFDKLDL